MQCCTSDRKKKNFMQIKWFLYCFASCSDSSPVCASVTGDCSTDEQCRHCGTVCRSDCCDVRSTDPAPSSAPGCARSGEGWGSKQHVPSAAVFAALSHSPSQPSAYMYQAYLREVWVSCALAPFIQGNRPKSALPTSSCDFSRPPIMSEKPCTSLDLAMVFRIRIRNSFI